MFDIGDVVLYKDVIGVVTHTTPIILAGHDGLDHTIVGNPDITLICKYNKILEMMEEQICARG